jgi:hypothetical protein
MIKIPWLESVLEEGWMREKEEGIPRLRNDDDVTRLSSMPHSPIAPRDRMLLWRNEWDFWWKQIRR